MKDKGLLFYYDWLEPFSALDGEEFKELFLAMLRFQRYDKKPPKFNGSAGIVAQFVFPQLARTKKCQEAGQKGGLASLGKRGE